MDFFTNKSNTSIDSNSVFAKSMFSEAMYNYLSKYYIDSYDNVVVLCIGTDRSTGDCLGPLIGYKLSYISRLYPSVHILGTLENPVHAKNLEEKINYIYTSYSNPFIIAVDACLGRLERVGYIDIAKGPLKPGAGVNKDLPEVGDMHVLGVVNLGGFMEYLILQNTRLNTVMKMADVISTGFLNSFLRFFKQNEKLTTT